jgi:hypothetical protein
LEAQFLAVALRPLENALGRRSFVIAFLSAELRERPLDLGKAVHLDLDHGPAHSWFHGCRGSVGSPVLVEPRRSCGLPVRRSMSVSRVFEL